jgi:hypothetical protein
MANNFLALYKTGNFQAIFTQAKSVEPTILGLSYFYSGQFQKAKNVFSAEGLRFAASAAEAEDSFPDLTRMKTSFSDFAKLYTTKSKHQQYFDDFHDKPSSENLKKLPLPTEPHLSFYEKSALAQAHIKYAYSVDPNHAGRALTVAETLKNHSIEGSLYAPWFIGHALLLHADLAKANGQAVMAEGIIEAALSQVDAMISESGRSEVLRWRCLKKKGELLFQWEKREDKGAELLESIRGNFDLMQTAEASEYFYEFPSLEMLV